MFATVSSDVVERQRDACVPTEERLPGYQVEVEQPLKPPVLLLTLLLLALMLPLPMLELLQSSSHSWGMNTEDSETVSESVSDRSDSRSAESDSSGAVIAGHVEMSIF